MRRLAYSAIAVAIVCSGVQAGGADVPVSVDEWSGLYAGVQVGGLWGNGDIDFEDGYAHDIEPDGYSAGFFAGYNRLLDNGFLIGFEAEVNMVDADDSGVFYELQQPYAVAVGPKPTSVRMQAGNYQVVPTVRMNLSEDWDASLRLRIGYAMRDWMPYLTGGIAWVRMNIEAVRPDDGYKYFDQDETLTGWTLGAGLEWKVNTNLHLRVQYRYTDYGSTNFTAHDSQSGFPIDGKLNYHSHMVTIGFSYRFD
ncbi:outer membrane protein [Nitratifractor sp.]